MLPNSLNQQQKKRRLKRLAALIVGGIVLAVGTVTCHLAVLAFSEIDLLTGQDWSHMAAAHVDANGVHVQPLGRAIVNQDGSDNQQNPPINTHGPHLSVRGNLSLTATMHGAANGSVLSLYARPPVIYDEWRAEPPTLRLTTQDSTHIQAQLWDGTDDAPVETQTFDAPLSNDTFDLTVERHSGWLTFSVDRTVIGSMRPHNLFDDGALWFGLDSTQEPWTLSALSARRLGTGRVSLIAPPDYTAPHKDTATLSNLATKRAAPLQIGAAIAIHPLLTDRTYRQLATRQFSIWTPENDFKPQFLHPQPNVYDFTEGDSLVAIARANDIALHGHTLVFGEANPKWMQQTPPAQRQQVMTDHITTVVSHYRSQVSEWDVVNEPLSDDPADYQNGGNGLRHHIWFEGMGETYIALAFQAAHAADPNAKLYLNEYGIEFDGQRWDALMALIARLKQAQVPIDGVGFQGHVHTVDDHIDPDTLRNHIQQLAALGLSSRVSEIDVHGEDQAVQAAEYAGAAGACFAEPTCTSFSTWGITDRYGSTTLGHTYPLVFGDDLIWDSGYNPKPAFSALQKSLGL